MYTERYEVEMQNIRAAMNRIVEEGDIKKEIRDFNEYVYNFLFNKYKGSVKKTEEVPPIKPITFKTILSLLNNVNFYREENRQIELFDDFLNEFLTPEDISCFLLIRSLVERELDIKIFDRNKKEAIDINYIALNRK